jgi:hypothetical protein
MTDKTAAPAAANSGESSAAMAERGPRIPLRQHLRTGIEAALNADPLALSASQCRTVLGLIVRSLVLEAACGRMAAIKVMLSLLAETQATEQSG